MRKFLVLVVALLALTIALPGALGATGVDTSRQEAARAQTLRNFSVKIDSAVLQKLNAAQTARTLIVFAEQADVSAAVALLWNSTPALRGRIHNTELALFGGANTGVTLAGDPNQSCGGTDRHDIPNNLFGYGRLNIWRSYQQLP